MFILFYILLIPISICQFTIYIQHIKTNIYLNILSQDIPQYIRANNILEIIIQSENPKEINNKIIFKYNLFGPTRESKNISLIQCTLKNKIPFNIQGPFYLKKNHLEKSFEIKIKDNLLHYTLEMIEDFYLGIFKNIGKNLKKQRKNIFVNLKFSI